MKGDWIFDVCDEGFVDNDLKVCGLSFNKWFIFYIDCCDVIGFFCFV